MRFWKYHGLGNDFIIVEQPVAEETALALCDRHTGVGADGVLVLASDPDPGIDTRVRVFNADGTEAGMCGNGLRCVARYLYDRGQVPVDRASVTVAMGEGRNRCERLAADRFRVWLAPAGADHPDLPTATIGADQMEVTVDHACWTGTRLWLGNPHLTIFTPEAPLPLAQRYGAALAAQPVFSAGVNVTFARSQPGGFDAVTHERGVGLTPACGSGACAVVAAATRRGHWPTGEQAAVTLPGGILYITVDPNGVIAMTGEAVRIFEGEVEA